MLLALLLGKTVKYINTVNIEKSNGNYKQKDLNDLDNHGGVITHL